MNHYVLVDEGSASWLFLSTRIIVTIKTTDSLNR